MIFAVQPERVFASEDNPGTFGLQIENDRFTDTDRHYTNGVRFSWVSDKTTDSLFWTKWARPLIEELYFWADNKAGRLGIAAGQNIYTPKDTDTRALVGDDRPYAGWLYGAVSLHAEASGTVRGYELDIWDSIEFNLGIVGPAALGEFSQNRFHDLIDVDRANGWDNQLENEPAVAVFAERKLRLRLFELGPFESDIIPHVGGALGNVFTQLNMGGTIRFGHGLDMDYGPPHIRPTFSGLEAVSDDAFGWYMFGGVDGRWVLHNIFLDGNLFADSHSVSKKSLVRDLQLGVAVMYKGARLAFTHVLRTKEFDQQLEADRFGTISLSYGF